MSAQLLPTRAALTPTRPMPRRMPGWLACVLMWAAFLLRALAFPRRAAIKAEGRGRRRISSCIFVNEQDSGVGMSSDLINSNLSRREAEEVGSSIIFMPCLPLFHSFVDCPGNSHPCNTRAAVSDVRSLYVEQNWLELRCSLWAGMGTCGALGFASFSSPVCTNLRRSRHSSPVCTTGAPVHAELAPAPLLAPCVRRFVRTSLLPRPRLLLICFMYYGIY